MPGLRRPTSRATTVSMSTSIRIVVPATGRTDSQRPAWRRVAITTRQTPASAFGPQGEGQGDLPALTVDASGEATKGVGNMTSIKNSTLQKIAIALVAISRRLINCRGKTRALTTTPKG